MKNLWITDDENVNSSEANELPNSYPQIRPQVFYYKFNRLTTKPNTISIYNNITHQLSSYYKKGPIGPHEEKDINKVMDKSE